MVEPAANMPTTSDHLWAELARLLEQIGLPDWASSIRTVFWGDPTSGEDDLEELADGLRFDLLRLAGLDARKRMACEKLEVALGYLTVHEWAALARPTCEQPPLGLMFAVDVRPRAADPVAAQALVMATARIDEARELVREAIGERRLG